MACRLIYMLCVVLMLLTWEKILENIYFFAVVPASLLFLPAKRILCLRSQWVKNVPNCWSRLRRHSIPHKFTTSSKQHSKILKPSLLSVNGLFMKNKRQRAVSENDYISISVRSTVLFSWDMRHLILEFIDGNSALFIESVVFCSENFLQNVQVSCIV